MNGHVSSVDLFVCQCVCLPVCACVYMCLIVSERQIKQQFGSFHVHSNGQRTSQIYIYIESGGVSSVDLFVCQCICLPVCVCVYMCLIVSERQVKQQFLSCLQ